MNNALNVIPTPALNTYYKHFDSALIDYTPSIISRFIKFNLMEFLLLKMGLISYKWVFIVVSVIVI